MRGRPRYSSALRPRTWLASYRSDDRASAREHDVQVVAMKSIVGVGMFIFAAAVPILAAKNKDRLALAISAVGLLIVAALVLIISLSPEH